MISTEQLLVSKAGFGIATATPAQRAACRRHCDLAPALCSAVKHAAKSHYDRGRVLCSAPSDRDAAPYDRWGGGRGW